MSNANELLRAYAAENSEEAFRELVDRYLALVYSTALRVLCGDAALAQDVAQMVFADLARKSRSLPANVVVPGWLYRHTCFTAAKALRTESRRRAREREAVAVNSANDPEPLWNQLAPFLDEAIGSLPARDRDALVMRFFDKQDFRSLAATLRLSEDAAQKRVSRALEKLRGYFERRGIPVTGSTLASMIAAHAVSATPATLATAVTANAFAQAGAVATPLIISLLMGKIKTIAVGVVAVAAVTTPLVLQHDSISRLRSENEQLRQQFAARPEPAPVTTLKTSEPDQAHARELLQLRAEVARLRREQANVARVEAENKRLRALRPSVTPAEAPVAAELWADRGFASPMDTLQTAHWAVRTANIEKFRESLFITDEARRTLHNVLAKMAAKVRPEEAEEARKILEDMANRGWDAEEGILFPMIAQNQKHGYKSYRVLSQTAPQPDELDVEVQLDMNTAPSQTRQLRFKQFGNVWKQVIDVRDLPAEVRN
jgi:RNA polymerase sigma factor (sigma-70 family)